MTLCYISYMRLPLQWPHNGRDSVSKHRPYDCLLNRLFIRRSKKTSKLRVTGLCARNSPGPVNSPLKGSVTRKMVPFDDVIMICFHSQYRFDPFNLVELSLNFDDFSTLRRSEILLHRRPLVVVNSTCIINTIATDDLATQPATTLADTKPPLIGSRLHAFK